jgi:hypothetical protein
VVEAAVKARLRPPAADQVAGAAADTPEATTTDTPEATNDTPEATTDTPEATTTDTPGATTGTPEAATDTPVDTRASPARTEPASLPASEPRGSAAATEPRASAIERLSSEAPASALEPHPTADERWDVPPSPPRRPAAPSAARANKLGSRAARELVSVKAPLGDVRGVLASIRQASDRDEVVRLGLDGALSVSRSAVFFALRKGLLKGWDGIGSGVTQDSARNLWIPTSTASLFQRVVESGVGYFGPYGNAIADGLFRAAVGSRGGDLALLPVKVSGKVVGMLACDDVRAGPQGQQRLELLATAIEEAFGRIIVKQKQG